MKNKMKMVVKHNKTELVYDLLDGENVELQAIPEYTTVATLNKESMLDKLKHIDAKLSVTKEDSLQYLNLSKSRNVLLPILEMLEATNADNLDFNLKSNKKGISYLDVPLNINVLKTDERNILMTFKDVPHINKELTKLLVGGEFVDSTLLTLDKLGVLFERYHINNKIGGDGQTDIYYKCTPKEYLDKIGADKLIDLTYDLLNVDTIFYKLDESKLRGEYVNKYFGERYYKYINVVNYITNKMVLLLKLAIMLENKLGVFNYTPITGRTNYVYRKLDNTPYDTLVNLVHCEIILDVDSEQKSFKESYFMYTLQDTHAHKFKHLISKLVMDRIKD